MEQITITIQDKRQYNGDAEKHPEGDFYADNIKYTCWDKAYFQVFEIGDIVDVSYTEKSNDFNGKMYTNRNISKMYNTSTTDKNEEDNIIVENKEDNNTEEIVSLPQIIEIGNLKYEVTLRLLK